MPTVQPVKPPAISVLKKLRATHGFFGAFLARPLHFFRFRLHQGAVQGKIRHGAAGAPGSGACRRHNPDRPRPRGESPSDRSERGRSVRRPAWYRCKSRPRTQFWAAAELPWHQNHPPHGPRVQKQFCQSLSKNCSRAVQKRTAPRRAYRYSRTLNTTCSCQSGVVARPA